jgi:heme-degrading monooxygenase HmoA
MAYKVVSVFKLKPGMAEEELQRCKSADSMLNILKTMPGFINYEVVKLNEDSTLTIQTWQAKEFVGPAMQKAMQARASMVQDREDILLSRGSFAGELIIEG